MKIIFGNLPPIYEVHKQMLEELCWASSHWKEDLSIGKVFLKYVSYCVWQAFTNFKFGNHLQELGARGGGELWVRKLLIFIDTRTV